MLRSPARAPGPGRGPRVMHWGRSRRPFLSLLPGTSSVSVSHSYSHSHSPPSTLSVSLSILHLLFLSPFFRRPFSSLADAMASSHIAINSPPGPRYSKHAAKRVIAKDLTLGPPPRPSTPGHKRDSNRRGRRRTSSSPPAVRHYILLHLCFIPFLYILFSASILCIRRNCKHETLKLFHRDANAADWNRGFRHPMTWNVAIIVRSNVPFYATIVSQISFSAHTPFHDPIVMRFPLSILFSR